MGEYPGPEPTPLLVNDRLSPDLRLQPSGVSMYGVKAAHPHWNHQRQALKNHEQQGCTLRLHKETPTHDHQQHHRKLIPRRFTEEPCRRHGLITERTRGRTSK